MRKKISFLLVFALVLSCFVPMYRVSAAYSLPFDVYADAVYLVNDESGRVIYEKNADKPLYPASLTKIMTAIIAIENVPDLDAVSGTAQYYMYNDFVGLNVSHAGITFGEEVTMRNLLNAMLLVSACEAANIIAGTVADGSLDAFVGMMNEKARELGCKDTVFRNAHGLFNEDQVTTARDMYTITKYAMSLPEFAEIVGQASYTMDATNKRGEHKLDNINYLMNLGKGGPSYYEYATGVKTGTLPQSGKNLVATAEKDGMGYTLVLLGVPLKDENGESFGSHIFAEAKSIFEWAFSTFRVKPILDIKSPVETVPISYAWGIDSIQVKPEKVLSALVPDNITLADIQKDITLPDSIEAPVSKGDPIGSMKLYYLGEYLGESTLVSAESVEKSQLMVFIENVKKVVFSGWFKGTLIVILVLLALYILLTIIRNYNRRRYRPVKKRRKF